MHVLPQFRQVARQEGRGPTNDIWRMSTFQSCGSSSSWLRRRNLPGASAELVIQDAPVREMAFAQGPDLVEHERRKVPARLGLVEDHRAAEKDTDGEQRSEHRRRGRDQQHGRCQNVDQSLEPTSTSRGLRASCPTPAMGMQSRPVRPHRQTAAARPHPAPECRAEGQPPATTVGSADRTPPHSPVTTSRRGRILWIASRATIRPSSAVSTQHGHARDGTAARTRSVVNDTDDAEPGRRRGTRPKQIDENRRSLPRAEQEHGLPLGGRPRSAPGALRRQPSNVRDASAGEQEHEDEPTGSAAGEWGTSTRRVARKKRQVEQDG